MPKKDDCSSAIQILKDGKFYIIRNKHAEVTLSKKQSMLISCLMNKINDRTEIIENLWGGEANSIKANKYNQLIYQIRSRFAKNGLPESLLITLPRHGLYLNERYLHKKKPFDIFEIKALNDQTLHYHIDFI